MLGWIAYLTTMTAAGSEAVPSVIIACIYIALLLWSSSLLLHFFPRAARRRNRYSTMLGLIFAFAAAPHGAANIAFSVFDYSKSPLAAYAATRAFVLLCMTVAKQMVLAMDMIIQVPTAAVDDSSVLTPPFVAVQVIVCVCVMRYQTLPEIKIINQPINKSPLKHTVIAAAAAKVMVIRLFELMFSSS